MDSGSIGFVVEKRFAGATSKPTEAIDCAASTSLPTAWHSPTGLVFGDPVCHDGDPT